MNFISPWALGASLYTPATRPDLASVGHSKLTDLTSLIYCTEDAVREADVPHALHNLEATLGQIPLTGGPLRFIRVRNLEVLGAVCAMNLGPIMGLVLPKIHDGNLGEYLRVIERSGQHHLQLMPTLETREALSEHRMALLRDLIFHEGWQNRILTLRIGGNDLLNALGVRRSPGRTLYEGPLERVISMLISIFKPYGLSLSSPVYEVYTDTATLAREVQQDLEYGLCGKTIIHPSQLATVLDGYRVYESEFLEARAILDPAAPAVFKMNGRMCEPATHTRWATDLVARAELYGVRKNLTQELLTL